MIENRKISDTYLNFFQVLSFILGKKTGNVYLKMDNYRQFSLFEVEISYALQ